MDNRDLLNTKVRMPVSVDVLENILNYLLTQFEPNKRFIKNIKTLFEVLDLRIFERNDYELTLVTVLQHVVMSRLQGVSDTGYILNYLRSINIAEDFIAGIETMIYNKRNLGYDIYIHLDNMISGFLKYIFIFQFFPHFKKFYDMFNFNGFIAIDNQVEDFLQCAEELVAKSRKVKRDRDAEKTISLNGTMTEDTIYSLSTVYDELTSPSSIYRTGLKELNRLLGGGFKRRRLYMFVGPTNNFKSGLLLYCALWIKQFNPEAKPKFSDKKLLVLVISMENDDIDTYDRLFSINTGGTLDIGNMYKEAYLEYWKTIFTKLNSNIDVELLYTAPGKDIAYFRNKKQEYEDEGYEVIGMIIDHLGNTTATSSVGDTRKDLINNAYEMSDFAKSENIVCITAMHANSEFDNVLQKAKDEGKTNLVRMMGRHCIADAKYVDRAIDQTFYMLLEQSRIDGKMYLGLKREKTRQKRQMGADSFVMELVNGIVIQNDVYSNVSLTTPCIPGTEMNFNPMMQPISDPFDNNRGRSSFRMQQNHIPPYMQFMENQDIMQMTQQQTEPQIQQSESEIEEEEIAEDIPIITKEQILEKANEIIHSVNSDTENQEVYEEIDDSDIDEYDDENFDETDFNENDEEIIKDIENGFQYDDNDEDDDT